MVSHEVRRYAFAVLTVAVAVLFARALDRYISPHVSPPYFLAVMLSAAYAGAGPGLVATVLSSLAIAWFDLGTTHNLDLGLDDLIRLAIFIITALIISSISAARKAAERELRIALDELSALDRSKDEFIATMSHELRTPLAGILGWLRILKVKDLDAETRALALDSVEQSANTQAMLVSDLLDASRIVLGGRFASARSPIDAMPLWKSPMTARESTTSSFAMCSIDSPRAAKASARVASAWASRSPAISWNCTKAASRPTAPAGIADQSSPFGCRCCAISKAVELRRDTSNARMMRDRNERRSAT